MQDYSVAEAVQILGLSERMLSRFVQAGFIRSQSISSAEQDDNSWGAIRTRLRLSFQDLVILRTAKDLLSAGVSLRRIRRTLRILGSQLPENQPLSGVRVSVCGKELVVRDTNGMWAPESGQVIFDFSVPEESMASVAPLEGAIYTDDEIVIGFLDEGDDNQAQVSLFAEEEVLDARSSTAEMTGADWMDLAEDFEAERRLLQARGALRRALECDPFDAEARHRLGKLLERESQWEQAESHYRLARQQQPDDPTLAVDHGRMLAQMDLVTKALEAFETARVLDPCFREAYLGSAEMYERMGNLKAAEQVLGELAEVDDLGVEPPPFWPTHS